MNEIGHSIETQIFSKKSSLQDYAITFVSLLHSSFLSKEAASATRR
jgi:hypothetical protein